MKILHITDSHGTVKSPESRNDLYYLTFLRKLKELEYIIKGNGINIVIHTGDLFHTSRVSNKFMGQTAEIIKEWGVPVYVVPGNHDIDGYTIETMDQTSLGLLAKTGVIELLDRMHPRKFVIGKGKHTVCISGQEYYADIDSGNPDDYDMQQVDGDINILAIHGYVADTPQNPHIKCTYIKDIVTNADIVLSGHYHRSFAVEAGGVGFYNPGSMMRVEMTDWNKTHMPQYGILELEFNENHEVVYDYKLHTFRIAKPGNVVFDYTSKGIVKTHGVTLENFKNSIANTMQTLNVNSLTTDPRTLITNVIADYVQNNTDIDDPYNHATLLEQLVDTTYNTATQKITDEDVVATKGFIPSQDYIKIAKVELHNFQSHEDTVVNLVDGFNIFIGESSNGKTSIVRAINWAINNKPLGTDFIMTGKKDCKVRITFSNGFAIERGRTLTDTGYYKVIQPDGNETEYRGFTNAVPVEIMNVHQMPKISITKNLETHLNMMTQLERPFLITESVNDKAVAIGHITGTSVVDECIRSTVASNMSDIKMLKELAKQKSDLEQQQQGYDITNLQNVKQTISKLQTDLTAQLSSYDKIKGIQETYEITLQGKQQIEQSVKDAEVLLTIKPLVEQYQVMVNQLQTLLSVKKKYDSISQELQTEQTNLQLANEIVKYKGVCEQAESLVNKGLCCCNILSKKKTLESSIQCHEEMIARYEQVITLKPLIDKINEGLSLVNNAVNIRNTYASLYIQNTSESSKLNNIKLGIEADNGTMQDIIKERNEYVLSIGVCPCCEQKITKKNVNSIIENLEGK